MQVVMYITDNMGSPVSSAQTENTFNDKVSIKRSLLLLGTYKQRMQI